MDSVDGISRKVEMKVTDDWERKVLIFTLVLWIVAIASIAFASYLVKQQMGL